MSRPLALTFRRASTERDTQISRRQILVSRTPGHCRIYLRRNRVIYAQQRSSLL